MRHPSLGRVWWVASLVAIVVGVGAFSGGAQPDEAETEPADARWALGIHANFPFLGISIRNGSDARFGYELNVAPIPQCEPPDPENPSEPPDEGPIEGREFECPNRLDLLVSTRGLWRVSDNARADFYLSGGPSATIRFGGAASPALREPFFATLAEIRIANWPIPRVYPVIDYGFALNLTNVFDFRWIAGGIGFHYVF